MDKRIIAVTPEEALQRGIIAQKKGNALEAEHWYRAVLNEHPDHPIANHNLGVLAVSLKLMDAALPFFKCALQHDSSISEYSLRYIEASVQRGQFARAHELIELARGEGALPEALRPVVMLLEAQKIDAVEPINSSKKPKLSEMRRRDAARKKKKIKSKPADAELNELLNLYQVGNYLMAEHRAVALTENFPSHPFAWKALGTILRQTKREKQSLRFMLKAVELDPNDAEAHFNAGTIFYELGKFEQALNCQKSAIKARHDYAEAHNSVGSIFVALGNLEEALASYERAVNISPGYAGALYNLANTLQMSDRLTEAVEVYRRTISASPRFAEAYNNLGTVLHAQGRESEAIQTFDQAIAYKPDFAEAFNNRGLVLHDMNQLKLAASSYEEAIKVEPNFAQAYNNMGVTLKELGQLDEARAKYEIAISLQPDYAVAHNNLGIIFAELTLTEKALGSYEKAIELQPNYAEAHNNVATLYAESGELTRALVCYEHASKCQPDNAEIKLNIGILLTRLGRQDEALETYESALLIKPDYAEAFYNKGDLLIQMERHDEAMACCRSALRIRPDYAAAMYSIGEIHRWAGQFNEALHHYQKAIETEPSFAEAHNNAGIALRHLKRWDEALVSYRQALTHKPDLAETHNNIGNLFTEIGSQDDALASYQAAIDLRPNFTEAHRLLSSYKKFRSRDKQYKLMEELLIDGHLSEEDTCNISFGLAKANDDLGEFEKAYNHYEIGNTLRKKLLGYDFSSDQKLFDQLRSAQNKIKNSQLGNGGLQSPISPISPIFIVGMPRSGTTLVEQIVSSHPEVTGAGELPFVERHGHNLAIGATASNEESLLACKQLYLDGLESVCEGAAFVTDKTPHNFLYLGLVAKILPEAKIIHVRRSPAAVCWANYTQYFSTNGLGYSYSLTDVVDYYRLYIGLMETWKSETSNVIYDLDYEMLVTNQEQETRWLLEKLGLAWDDRCLSPESNKRAVSTASNMQVRRKVYQGSSERWKAYAPFLEERYLGLLASL